MISTTSKYALKGVLYLAMHSNDSTKIMVKDISLSINVPQAYLAKLLQELSRQKIISSTRGPKGGFYLSEKDKKQPLINIINAIEGQKKLNSCLLSLKNCNKDKPCPLHKLYSPAKNNLMKSLETKTIQDIATEIENGITYLPL